MELNTISLSGGNWEELSNRLNYNFNMLGIASYRYKHILGPERGLFTSFEQLISTVTTPEVGYYAFITGTDSIEIYIYTGSDGWIQGGDLSIDVDVNDYIKPVIINNVADLVGIDFTLQIHDTTGATIEIPFNVDSVSVAASGIDWIKVTDVRDNSQPEDNLSHEFHIIQRSGNNYKYSPTSLSTYHHIGDTITPVEISSDKTIYFTLLDDGSTGQSKTKIIKLTV